MKHIVILGAGTAGTTMANQLRRKIPGDWSITIVDPEREHVYQPGLLFVPFGKVKPERLLRPRGKTLGTAIDWRLAAVEAVDTDAKEVVLEDGEKIAYDILIIATGSQLRPEETEELVGEPWYKSAFDFYTVEGATHLREALDRLDGGRVVVNVVEMPIKCPIAPLEFLFLADEYFTRRGLRDAVELIYATPLDGAFTKPIASRALGHLLEKKGVKVESEYNTGRVDGESKTLYSWDEREIPYDLLVTIPTHGGAPFLGTSGLGNELDFVPTDQETLEAKNHADVFVIGDATDLPTSKAGSVAHFESEVLVENVLRRIRGESPVPHFDGHANCFIESGWGKALLIDFNYEVEPLPGQFPLPAVGPFALLEETRINHWGKLAFEWVYWHAMLPGRPIPVPHRMSMAGKKRPQTQSQTDAVAS